MKTGHKVAAYGLALATVFGGTWAAGAAVGTAPPTADEPMAHNEHQAEPAKVPPGLSVSDNGYTLVLHKNESLGFHINGPDSKPVTKFAVEHEKRLHLIVVRRDGSNFRHVHPEMTPDGMWSVPLDLTEAGSYRVFATSGRRTGPRPRSAPTSKSRAATSHNSTRTAARSPSTATRYPSTATSPRTPRRP